MNKFINNLPKKPKDWPANEREAALDNVHNAIENFIKSPDFKTKEILISLCGDYDYTQISMLGLDRQTEYEAYLINTIWFYASTTGIQTVKMFLYEQIAKSARSHKHVCMFRKNEEPLIPAYQLLWEPLGLFYLCYQNYCFNSDKTFFEIIEEIIKYNIEKITGKNEINNLTRSFVQMFNDISYFQTKKINDEFAFSRQELFGLFSLESKLLKLNQDNPFQRPLRSVLMTTISNYILKSRNNYNSDFVCKFIPEDVAVKSIDNSEIWIKKIEYLNDEREQKVVPELFEDLSWLNTSWVDKIDLSAKRNYLVSSFCKNYRSEDMGEYGTCIYGYKNDRIAELIAPIIIKKNGEDFGPMLAQVVAFDVLYDQETIKEEIKYLCNIIDLYELNESEKKDFLEEIMQYWILSIKDKKWEKERERRYLIFMYDDYQYKEACIDEKFLKVKTSLFLYPDFVLGNNPIKLELAKRNNEKYSAISTKEYYHCENCLSNDYDNIWDKIAICPICGSKKYFLHNTRK